MTLSLFTTILLNKIGISEHDGIYEPVLERDWGTGGNINIRFRGNSKLLVTEQNEAFKAFGKIRKLEITEAPGKMLKVNKELLEETVGAEILNF